MPLLTATTTTTTSV